jgi:hypothetical protein
LGDINFFSHQQGPGAAVVEFMEFQPLSHLISLGFEQAHIELLAYCRRIGTSGR